MPTGFGNIGTGLPAAEFAVSVQLKLRKLQSTTFLPIDGHHIAACIVHIIFAVAVRTAHRFAQALARGVVNVANGVGSPKS